MAESSRHHLYWRIHNVCNLECGHCCYESGPRGYVPEAGVIDAVAVHLPGGMRRITVSGGESTAKPRLLERALEAIARERPRFDKEFHVTLQTNGRWLRDKKRAETLVVHWQEMGVKHIDITSSDQWHADQGLARSLLDHARLSTIMQSAQQRSGRDLDWHTRGAGYRVYPFGRAAKLPNDLKQDYSYRHASDTDGLTIAPDGKLYPCCWEVTAPLGSLVASRFEDIIEDARRDPQWSTLLDKGFGAMASQAGLNVGENASRNPCVACAKYFSHRSSCASSYSKEVDA